MVISESYWYFLVICRVKVNKSAAPVNHSTLWYFSVIYGSSAISWVKVHKLGPTCRVHLVLFLLDFGSSFYFLLFWPFIIALNTFWNPNGLKHRCWLQGVNRVPDVVQAPWGRFRRFKGYQVLDKVKWRLSSWISVIYFCNYQWLWLSILDKCFGNREISNFKKLHQQYQTIN